MGKPWITAIILFTQTLPVWGASGPKSILPQDLQKFLGAPPANFQKDYLDPAKKFRQAIELRVKKKNKEAIKALLPLAKTSALEDHAHFELMLLYKEEKDWDKALQQAEALINQFPYSTLQDNAQEESKEYRCNIAEKNLSAAKGKGSKKKAETDAYLCLVSLGWKEWGKRESLMENLYSQWKETKNILFEPFVAEIVQALPANAKIRIRIQKELKDSQLKNLGNLARYKSNSTSYPGIRAVNPDAELFNKALGLAMNSNWSDAKDSWETLLKDYPLSEHTDRAQYWVARAELALGNDKDAQKLFAQIADASPLTYYGLQSALWLKRDLRTLVKIDTPVVSEGELSLRGGILPLQQKSLLKLRAFLEVELRDQAFEEAKFLFQYKPSGSTLGQDNALGAMQLARLYALAGFHMGAFSHAYASTSLDGNFFLKENLDFIFPKPFWEQYSEISKSLDINPLLLASISKQESAFSPKAISRANALGLMQLLPSTAKDMNPNLNPDDLYDPKTNISLGAKYILKLLERFKSIPLALAAYNAGPSRAASWEKTFQESNMGKKSFDLDFFMDSIPYTETRKYVANIMRNYTWYLVLQNGAKIERIEELATQWQNPKQEQSPTIPLEPQLPQPTSM